MPSVSIVVPAANVPSDDAEGMIRCVSSALDQEYPLFQVLLMNLCKPNEKLRWFPAAWLDHPRLRVVDGPFPSRAAMCNAALALAHGDDAWILSLHTDTAPVVLKRSALRAMMSAARRQRDAAMVCGDYERVDSSGDCVQVHLAPFHRGRLRDTTDFGPAIAYRVDAAREVGGFDEHYLAAERYDLRLKLLERFRLVQIGDRFDGALCKVHSAGPRQSVFDYLTASRSAQLEMETALTNHLKRTGVHLAPEAHWKTAPRESRSGFGLTASVVIPVHRRPEFIGAALRSVQHQTVGDIEAVVVVNGGLDDPTVAEVRRFMPEGDCFDPHRPRVRLVVLDINNIGLSLNAGIEAAEGYYYVQLDSDDRLKPDAVERILHVFQSDPRIGMVIGSYEVWDRHETTGQLSRNPQIPVVTHDEWTAENGRNNLLRINGAGAPRSAPIPIIREMGGFGMNDSPHSRNYGEDYDLVLRISERYAVGRVWEPIYEVVRHAGGTDHSIDVATVQRNDDAKDHMRLEALLRRQSLNRLTS